MLGLKQFLTAAAAGAALLASAGAQAGYSGLDAGYHGSTIGYHLRDTTGATALTSGDDATGHFVLPFDFTFYGHTYAAGSEGWISTNGLLGFNLGNEQSYCCNSTQIGNSWPTNTVQAGWLDLVTTVTANTLGSAGSQELVFTWSGYEYGTGSNELFQAILHEGSNDIEFQYDIFNTGYHAANVGGVRGGGVSGGLDYIDYHTYVSLDDTGLLVTNLPEPGSVALLGLGLAGLALRHRQAR